MKVVGDYGTGFASVERLLEPEVTAQFLSEVLTAGGVTPEHLEVLGDNAEIAPRLRLRRQGLWSKASAVFDKSPIGPKVTVHMEGRNFPVLRTFHFGLVPAMSEIAKLNLLPTYCYFRIYQRGDLCLIHKDRPPCDHSLSLTLAYSDRRKWDLEVEHAVARDEQPIFAEKFEGKATAISMNPGDAVAYRGELHRHGRTTPNPNRWSAHLFLHFVEKGGPLGHLAFRTE